MENMTLSTVENHDSYLKSTYFIDSDNTEIIDFSVNATADDASDLEKAIQLYIAVRDSFEYDPFKITLQKDMCRASFLFEKKRGHCVDKALFYAACLRAINIPSRIGFAKVTNHIGTDKLEAVLKTNQLVPHGYTEVYLNKKWVKATPAFNKGLCDKLNVPPLSFNGKDNSTFQPFSADGTQFMEYIEDYGQFEDFPYDLCEELLTRHYPHVMKDYDKVGYLRMKL